MAAAAGLPCTPHSANLSLVTLCTMHMLGAIANAGKYLELSIEGTDYYPWQQGLFREDPYAVRDGHVTHSGSSRLGHRDQPRVARGGRASRQPPIGVRRMQPEEVRTSAQARAIVEERGLQHVKVGVFDNDGILRGKYVEREKFCAALEKGMGFCDVVLGWDSNDQQYDNITFTGWHTAFPDAAVRLLPQPAAPCRSRATCCCSSANSPGAPRRSARARRCAACCSAPPPWATRPRLRPSTSSSSSARRRRACARSATAG